MKAKLFWGALAGILIVLVKILGPDKIFVQSLFEGAATGGIAFYVFISAITILLGTISGLFSKEKEPVKLLIFCASVPALLTTVTTEQREPAATGSTSAPAVDRAQLDTPMLPPLLISTAHAQSADKSHECNEGTFFQNFTQTGAQYLSGAKRSNQPFYAAVVASTQNYEEAKSIADKIYRQNKNFAPFVGCKRPGNANYPVIVGQIGTQAAAAEWIGRFEEAGILNAKPYLSFYEHRSPVYTPS